MEKERNSIRKRPWTGRGDAVELRINILAVELTHQKKRKKREKDKRKNEGERRRRECPAIPESSNIHARIIAAMNIHMEMNI